MMFSQNRTTLNNKDPLLHVRTPQNQVDPTWSSLYCAPPDTDSWVWIVLGNDLLAVCFVTFVWFRFIFSANYQYNNHMKKWKSKIYKSHNNYIVSLFHNIHPTRTFWNNAFDDSLLCNAQMTNLDLWVLCEHLVNVIVTMLMPHNPSRSTCYILPVC